MSCGASPGESDLNWGWVSGGSLYERWVSSRSQTPKPTPLKWFQFVQRVSEHGPDAYLFAPVTMIIGRGEVMMSLGHK